MSKKLIFSALLLLFAFSNGFSHDHRLKKGFIQQLVLRDLNNPTCLAIAPDGRIFITEKSGSVWVIQDGELITTPFLTVKTDEHGERGLGSIVLDPDFDKNGFVYIYYSVYNRNFNRLVRYTANGNKAIPNSAKILMDFDQLAGTIHNSGAMRFAADGTLFVSVGDGVSAGNGQRENNTLGKMIRINPDGSIPKDNPFYSKLEGKNRAIYAFGFRNPFTFDLSPSTGQILANDVGNTAWEEVNDVKAGKNYGWPITEGMRTTEEVPANYEDPLFTYPHGAKIGCAVVGGAFYEPEKVVFPEEFVGKYFFSDYCLGVISVMEPTTGKLVDTIMWGADQLSNMVVSKDGELYYLSFSNGELWKITYVGDGSPFISEQPASLLRVVGEDALFHISVYGDDLKYQWYVNDDPVAGATTDTFEVKSVIMGQNGDKIYCKVSNNLGEVNSKTVTLEVTNNQRPVPVITAPLANQKFVMGQKLPYEGGATDAEDGQLNADKLEWKIDFLHDEHAHPGMPYTSGITKGELEIPVIGETDTNVWYRIYLKATDSEGLTKEVYRDIYPIIDEFKVTSSPSNLNIGLDGTLFGTPYTKYAVRGNQRVLTAPVNQVRNDSLFKFIRWETRGTVSDLEISAGEQPEYKAIYEYEKPFFDGNGDGLKGRYYTNIEFKEPAEYERIDGVIDFYWNWFSPVGNGPNDSCSIHWKGSILAPITGEYTFHTEFDDGAKVQIHEAIVIDELDNQFEGTASNVIYLFAGERYNIDVWYIEKRWDCKMKLSWAYTGQELQIIPQKFLYSDRVSDSIRYPNGKESELYLYPNPADDQIIILFRSLVESIDKIEIYDANGKLVKDLVDQNNTNRYELKLDDFEQGVYFVRAYSDETVYESKFQKLPRQ